MFFYPFLKSECLKIRLRLPKRPLKQNLELPGPLSGPWTPAESEFGSALVMCVRAHHFLRPPPPKWKSWICLPLKRAKKNGTNFITVWQAGGIEHSHHLVSEHRCHINFSEIGYPIYILVLKSDKCHLQVTTKSNSLSSHSIFSVFFFFRCIINITSTMCRCCHRKCARKSDENASSLIGWSSKYEWKDLNFLSCNSNWC